MTKKLVLSVLAIFFALGLGYAQTQTPEAKAKAKSDGIIKAIEGMIKNKAIADKKPAPDPKSLFTATQKKAVLTAYVNYYMGQDTLKAKRESVAKAAADRQAKAAEINAKVATLNALGGKTVETEEEGNKIKAEVEQGKAEIEKMNTEIEEMKTNILKQQEENNAYPEVLESRLDSDMKKTLNAEQNKYYEEIKAKQKAKKGS